MTDDMSTMKFTLNTSNLYGPINGCLAFLPRMKEMGEGGIIMNTGSKQGITTPPGNIPYNVSNAALKCYILYTEGLEHDLRSKFIVKQQQTTFYLVDSRLGEYKYHVEK